MDRIAHTLAEFTTSELDRIGALFAALADVLPPGLAAWIRHLVACERDNRAGIRYLLCRPDVAIEARGLGPSIVAVNRLRNASIDTATTRLLEAALQVLEDERRLTRRLDR